MQLLHNSGYYNREDHQDISFADGWIRTGDIGQMDERGYVKVTGRSKDVIIRGGMNIYPAEIENLLVKYPGIQQAAIVGLPDEKWGEIVAAILLPDSEKKPPEPRVC